MLQGESGALSHAHFKAEGDVEFRSILFIPPKAPWDFYDTYYQRKAAVKLYVRRVFISDEFDDLLPATSAGCSASWTRTRCR